jgi:ABC-type transport system involved in multi-copper enzyme maturation permease subunit
MQKSYYGLVALCATFLPVFAFSETAAEHIRNIMFEKLLPISEARVVASKYIVLLIVALCGSMISAMYFLLLSYIDVSFSLQAHIVFLSHILSVAVNVGVFITMLACSNKEKRILFGLASIVMVCTFLPVMRALEQVDLSNIELIVLKFGMYYWQTPGTYDLLLSLFVVLCSYPIAVFLQQRKSLR